MIWQWWLQRTNRQVGVLLHLIVFFLFCAIGFIFAPENADWVKSIQHWHFDARTHWSTVSSDADLPEVALVEFSQPGPQTPATSLWSEKRLKQLLNKLHAYQAALIIVDLPMAADMLASKPLDNNKLSSAFNAGKLAADHTFNKLLLGYEVILDVDFRQGDLPPATFESIGSLMDLQAQSSWGFIAPTSYVHKKILGAGIATLWPDQDGVLRKIPMVLSGEHMLYETLPMIALRLQSNAKEVAVNLREYRNKSQFLGIQLDNRLVKTDVLSHVNVPCMSKYNFMKFSAQDVIQGEVAKDQLANKVIFVSSRIIQPTYLLPNGSRYDRTHIHASTLYGLLQDSLTHKPAWGHAVSLAVLLIVGIGLSFIYPILSLFPLMAVFLFLMAALNIGDWLLWHFKHLDVSLTVVLISLLIQTTVHLFYLLANAYARKKHLRLLVKQYVPDEHVSEVLRSPRRALFKSDSREMSVMFTDIRNFTEITESMPVDQVKSMLNQWFTHLTDIIFKHHGTVDKYVGDMVIAFWGAPTSDKHHAQHVMAAALAMQNGQLELQQRFAAQGLPLLEMGIGINTGQMTVGDMGSKHRRNYTVLGDSVNLASRLEALTRYYGVKIIISEYTLEQSPGFLCRKLDKIRVRGKNKPVAIFELVSTLAQADRLIQKEIGLHEQALQYYFAQEWMMAQKLFAELHHKYPQRMVYHRFVDRIEKLIQSPPPANWDSVYQF